MRSLAGEGAMYYLSKAAVPVPAEAPYAAHPNEKQQWDYHQMRHQEAVRSASTQVDRSLPKSINPDAQFVQAHTRRFANDSRRAEIGRENRKLVDKLTSISKSTGQCAPSSQLSGYGSGPQPRSMGGGCTSRAPPRPPSIPAGPGGSHERSRSLNDQHRRKVQLRMDQDNASLVRRILSVKSTFDPVRDERSYQRHKRAVNVLQRLPEASGRYPRSLPPLAPNRPPVRGLEALIVPSDLHRSQSGPGDIGREALLESGCTSPDSLHAVTAPVGSLPEASREAGVFEGPQLGSQTYTFGDSMSSEASQPQVLSARERRSAAADRSQSREKEARIVEADVPKNSSREPPGGLGHNTLPRPAVGPGPEEEAGSAARGASAFGKRDSETERRQWTQGEAAPVVGISAQGVADNLQGTCGQANRSRMGLTGLSNVSELQYADDWDENSFDADASRSAVPSRGPSGMGSSL